jgi:C4-dicarboxylate-specific signal transduction histidine kinase
MAKTRNPQNLTLRNNRAQTKRIEALERQLKRTNKVIGTMAVWIAQTAGGCLSAENAAQLIQKLKEPQKP